MQCRCVRACVCVSRSFIPDSIISIDTMTMQFERAGVRMSARDESRGCA